MAEAEKCYIPDCPLPVVVKCAFCGNPVCDKHSVEGKYCSESCFNNAKRMGTAEAGGGTIVVRKKNGGLVLLILIILAIVIAVAALHYLKVITLPVPIPQTP
jgi:hypothetical protein